MINVVVLMGRLVADPELKQTPSGVSVTSFRIAVDRNFSNKQTGERQADFINVVAWRSTAEFVCKYFRQGSMIALEGSLQSRRATSGRLTRLLPTTFPLPAVKPSPAPAIRVRRHLKSPPLPFLPAAMATLRS